MKFTIGKKLGLGFGILLYLFIVIGFFYYYDVKALSMNIAKLTDKEEPKSSAAYEMEIHAIGLELGILNYLFTTDSKLKDYMDKDDRAFKRYHTDFLQLTEMQKENTRGNEVAQIYEELRTVGESLMYAKDYQKDLFLQISSNFNKAYILFDQLISELIDPRGPDGAEKIHVSVKMKTNLAELGNWLGNFLQTQATEYPQRIAYSASEFLENLKKFESLQLTKEERAQAEEIGILFGDVHFIISEVFGIEYAFNEYLGRFTELRQGLHQILHLDIKESARNHLEEAKEEGTFAAKRAKRNTIVSIISAFLFGGLIIFFLTRHVSNTIKTLVLTTQRLGKGQLSERVEIKSRDELGMLGESFNKMAEDLERYMTEKNAFQHSLEESEEKYSNLFINSNDAIIIHDFEGNISDANKKVADLFGYSKSEVLSLRIHDLHPHNALNTSELAFEKIKRHGLAAFEIDFLKKDDQVFPAEVSSNVLEIAGKKMVQTLIRDITERKKAAAEKKKLEAQLLQSQKMQAIGTLAGGIAHDFNNILSAIIGYTELSIMNRNLRNQESGYLENILKAGNRAKDLIKHILTFSRLNEHEIKPVQVKVIVKEALKLLRASLPSTIDIRQKIECDSLVMGDITQIHQIIMNLCTNAGHSMREKGGILYVDLTHVMLDSNSASSYPDLRPGSYLNLTVSDTGHGMPPDVLNRIFDPFFTTKEVGEGTGMGLSVVLGIVKSYGGTIYAYSEMGKGSSFKVLLPTIEGSLEQDIEIEEVMPKGKERILFVDDERDLVKIAEQMLESLGYKVTIRTSSVEALSLFQTKSNLFDLVITDMTMPQMTGYELAEKLLAIRKDLPIILCTGFSHQITKMEAAKAGIKEFLMKPLTLRDLANNVRKVLDEISHKNQSKGM